MELLFFAIFFFLILIPLVLGIIIPVYKNHSSVTGGIINYDSTMKKFWFSGASGQSDDTSGGGGSGYVFTGVTSAYTKAGGKFTNNTYKLESTSLTTGGGSSTGNHGSASITVMAE